MQHKVALKSKTPPIIIYMTKLLGQFFVFIVMMIKRHIPQLIERAA